MVGLFARYSVLQDVVAVFSTLVAALASVGASVRSILPVVSGCGPRMRPLPVQIIDRGRRNGHKSLRCDGVGQVHLDRRHSTMIPKFPFSE